MVIDASAIVSAFSNLRAESALDVPDPVAPDLVVSETLNAFWQLARSGMAVPERDVILASLDQIRIVPTRPYAERAAEIAARFDHPIYDCFYLALAEAEDDAVLTADARLARKLAKSTLRKRIRLVDL